MSTDKVDAREAWADEFLTKLDTYAGGLNQAGSLQFAAKRELTAFARTPPEGYVQVPIEPTTQIISAILCSEAVDDEGSFPALLDLIGYSGESKNHTVMRAAYKAMIAASTGDANV